MSRPSGAPLYTLLVLLLVSRNVSGSTIPWWNIKLAQEQGPNACVVEEIPGTKHQIWTECKYWNSRDVCGSKPLLRYECCEGFRQIPGIHGCTGVTPLQNVLETAKKLGASQFVKYIEKAGLTRELSNDGPFTLFVPSDEVFKDLPRDRRIRLDTASPDQLRPILEYHLVEGRVTSAQFKADLLVPTRYSGHKLRINKYSSRIETVNCALLQRKDQEANNGVVHIISSLLEPSYSLERDLAELLAQDGRFQELSRAMDKSGLMVKLRDPEQAFTIFAPSDEAFTKIQPSRLSKILNDRNALRELLDNHIVPHAMCTPAIIDEHKVRTLGSGKVTIGCDRKGVKVDDNRLRADFTLGLNGVIYLVDNVLMPDRAKSIIQILEEEKLSSFLQLVRFSGLEDAFENFGEYTIFVPSEAAMFSLPAEILSSLKSNKEKARKFVLFHSTQGRIKTDRMNNNQKLMSLDEQNPLRIQLYRAGVTTNVGPRVMAAVEGASVQRADRQCINGVIHIINKALSPVNQTAGEYLHQNGTYKIFLKAMEQVSSDNSDLDFTKPKTFFVPSDEAFQKIGKLRLQQMLSDSLYMTKVVKNHISQTMVMTDNFQPDLHYSVPSYFNMLSMIQEDGRIKVNGATASECDILTSNGVVHKIDKVLLPEDNNDV
ncbi:transforming growth factor-beta-induced protein ig-h3-like [Macrosteles quadrilineatus]|uniref:transforming growth factor-beta-induced protein ig-h3-like n=1 Tax=Macrosteles quadrilineatus TaxID=74068 RepID=UPI0023E26F0A|nr:transforming growth factor-beta-induced protein ig-h3-like [Macrosteles quadrilineatus]